VSGFRKSKLIRSHRRQSYAAHGFQTRWVAGAIADMLTLLRDRLSRIVSLFENWIDEPGARAVLVRRRLPHNSAGL
jgi:hypothetical protein